METIAAAARITLRDNRQHDSRRHASKGAAASKSQRANGRREGGRPMQGKDEDGPACVEGCALPCSTGSNKAAALEAFKERSRRLDEAFRGPEEGRPREASATAACFALQDASANALLKATADGGGTNGATIGVDMTNPHTVTMRDIECMRSISPAAFCVVVQITPSMHATSTRDTRRSEAKGATIRGAWRASSLRRGGLEVVRDVDVRRRVLLVRLSGGASPPR